MSGTMTQQQWPGLDVSGPAPTGTPQPPMGSMPEARPATLAAPPTEASNDTKPDAYYHFHFYSASGDNYEGYTYDDADKYTLNQNVTSPAGANYGHYVIDYKQDYPYDLSYTYGSGTSYYNEGAVYVTAYHDYNDTTTPYTYSPTYSPSTPPPGSYTDYTPYNYQNHWYSTTYGLGYEYDWVQKGSTYDDYGYGGYYTLT